MALIVVGASHHTAPLAVREKLAFPTSAARALLSEVAELCGAREAVLLSTCNRTEVYVVEGDADAVPPIGALLSQRLGSDASGYLFVRRDREAIAHLFRVAAGMDSMILGEAQIHGQVRDAWEICRGHAGIVLNRLFQTSLLVASRVRTETGIGRGAASVSSAAVQLSKKIFGSLNGRHAMVLGAGEMAELALACFADEGVRVAIVANRTYDKAAELGARYGAEALRYDDAWSRLRDVDVLLTSTASRNPVVTKADVEPTLADRGGRPLCILDVALPRDVAPDVASLDNVFLYDLDDLRAAAAATLDRRSEDMPAAERIIEAEREKYWQWLTGLATVPVLTEFREAMDRVRRAELAAAGKRLGSLSPEQSEAIEHFSRALMNKFLHEPTVRLRAAAGNGVGLGIIDAAHYLFGLSGTPAKPSSDISSNTRVELTEEDA
ncbi:MAG: glutamyl-tRNA reductase [Gemmatimonadaceae bacterium]